jgi:L-asparaginase II
MSTEAHPSDAVLVEILRGDLVEIRHRGAAAIVDAAGTIVANWSDIERSVFARSAITPLQVLRPAVKNVVGRVGGGMRPAATLLE